MGVLFIVSIEEAAGKTALCAGLAINFLNGGKTVGYLKPMDAGKSADGDIAFMRKVVGAADVVNASDMIKNRDILLVEGDATSQATYGAVKEMKAKVIAVEAYTGQASKYVDIYKWFDKSLLGLVLNKVPASQLKSVKEKATTEFSAAGIKMLGVIPENRALLAITIGELADIIKGRILNNPEKSGELIENYMLGAMVVGSGVDYFVRKSHKAAIIHQDRPDMQLAALETPTGCLVLSGSNQPPIDNVVQKAKSRGIPVITTESGTPSIIAHLEEALLNTRLRQEKKLSGLGELVKQGLDLKVII